jgi:YbbR domain-containing protein
MRIAANLRTNLGLKLLSLVLALLLWSFVRGAKVIEREYTIGIDYVNLPDSLLFLEEPPKQMRVVLSGPAQELLLRLQAMRDMKARIDLSGATAEMDRVVPSLSDITEPKSEVVSVERILQPSVIGIRLARRVERRIPVVLDLQRDAKGAYCLADSPTVEPRDVVCVGPEPWLDKLQTISTQPIAIGTHRGQSTSEVPLRFNAKRLQCVPERVKVTLTTDRMRSRNLGPIALTLVPPARAGWSAEMDTSQVVLTVAGPEPAVEALQPDQLGLYVDASRLVPGRYDSLQVIAQMPPWIELVQLEPEGIGLTVWRLPERSRPDSTQGQGGELP